MHFVLSNSVKPVGPASQAYVDMVDTADYKLCAFIYELQSFLSFLRTDGVKRESLTRMRDLTASVTARFGSEEHLSLLSDLRAAVISSFEAWLALPALECGRLPSDKETISTLFSIDLPVEKWMYQGQAYQAVSASSEPVWEAMCTEVSRWRADQKRASVRIGGRVTVISIGGVPSHILSVTSAGETPDQFILENGSVIEWQERAISHGLMADWRIVSGENKHETVRSTRVSDNDLAALHRGRWTPALGIIPEAEARHIDPTFRTEPVKVSRELSAALSGSMNLSLIVEEVLPDADYGTLLAYMMRRFGYSPRGSDPYKSLCGAWMMSTPHPDLYLIVEPSVSGTGYAFFYALATEVCTALREAERKIDYDYEEGGDTAPLDAWMALAGPLYHAARVAIVDLLRPVGIRDSWIDAEGRVPDGDIRFTGGYDTEAEDEDEEEDDISCDPSDEDGEAEEDQGEDDNDDEDDFDEDAEEENYKRLTAERHPSSGYGVDPDIFANPEAFFKLMAKISELDEDPAVAIAKAVEKLTSA